MTSTDLQALFEAAATRNEPYPEGRYEGRGIVICAGGERLFTCAWVLIGILRRVVGCKLPIQVWHLGPEEIGPPMQALLEEAEVEVVDTYAVALRHPVRSLGGWEMKPYAIIHSRFREVILIDADNVPVIDPTTLFDWPEYAATGALFWPDVVRLKADNPIWKLCGVAYRSTATIESGQVVVDKERCWHALQLTLFMNEHSDFYYRHLAGDKDTFFIAWLRLGQPFAMTSHRPAHLSETFYQKDFQGRTVFQHRNNAKWSYSGQNPRVPRFQHEDICLELLVELRGLWNGRVFRPPPASAEAQRSAAALQQVRWFDLQRIGDRSRRLELLAANRIGEGRADDAFYWWVAEDTDGLVLGLEGRRQTECRLRQRANGSWFGRSFMADAVEIELQSANGLASLPGTESLPAGQPTEALRDLLAKLLAVAERRATDGEAIRDLAGALRLLAVAEPGFAATMAGWLAGPGDRDHPLSQCLSAVLAETTDGRTEGPARRQGYRYGHRRDPLSENYDRLP
jgi:hypothetical protein